MEGFSTENLRRELSRRTSTHGARPYEARLEMSQGLRLWIIYLLSGSGWVIVTYRFTQGVQLRPPCARYRFFAWRDGRYLLYISMHMRRDVDDFGSRLCGCHDVVNL
jgi:hypothetical protein